MLTTEEQTLLKDYKKALKSYYHNHEVVDLDKKLSKKPEDFIVRLDEVLPELSMIIPPVRQSNYSILYIVKGGGKHKIGNITFIMKPRTLIVIPAYTIHSARYSADCKGYNLTFNLRFFLQDHFPKHHILQMDLFNLRCVPYAYVNIKVGKSLTEILELILDEKFNSRKRKQEMIALKVLEVIILCERILKIEKDSQKKSVPSLVIRFMEMVSECFKTHHTVSYYADKLRVHPNQLNANTKKYLNQSAKATIDKLLIQEAEYLLVQTPFSVKEIAYELGFQSASHFFRFFKRHKGHSPGLFRHHSFENVTS